MKQKIIKGNLEYIKPKDNHLNGIKWVDDPNGSFEIRRFEYNWFEKLLIRIRLMRDKRYNGKYFIGVDPFEAETLHTMKTSFDRANLTKEKRLSLAEFINSKKTKMNES